MSDEKPMGQVIQIDEARMRDHLGEMRSVENKKPRSKHAMSHDLRRAP
jgi:hypothetical protein